MTAAALAEAAPGRFQLGIGASSPVVVGDWNAAEFTEPYARSRDMLRFLRAALAGELVDREFETFRGAPLPARTPAGDPAARSCSPPCAPACSGWPRPRPTA